MAIADVTKAQEPPRNAEPFCRREKPDVCPNMVRSRGLSVSEASSSEAASFYFDRPLPRMTNSNFEALKDPFPANATTFKNWRRNGGLNMNSGNWLRTRRFIPPVAKTSAGVLMRKIWLEESARRLMCAIR
jgi:hypothetical protein